MPVDSQLPPLIDLHCHLLPGIDDGARDIAESLAMLRLAAADGIATLVATPHAHHARGVDICTAVTRLQACALEAGIDVRIIPGSETRITSGMDDDLRAGRLMTLGTTRWLLLELPLHDEWPVALVLGVIDKLQSLGVHPILAHAERYPFVQHNPAALRPFIERGVPVQVNASALSYRERDPERITADALLSAHFAHIIASDAHNARYRPPSISAALQRAATLTSQEYATWMQSVPGMILADEDVALPAL
jgi:protein-tyrosine phosphatase